jgi:hypothetical protein
MFNDDEEDLFKPISPKAPASNETKLYGHWQTVEWIPPQAKDGIVPKNERGNVLCPPLAHALPLVNSCMLLRLKGASCSALQLYLALCGGHAHVVLHSSLQSVWVCLTRPFLPL